MTLGATRLSYGTADVVQTGPGEHQPLGRILVATDRSATADLAVRWAAELAGRYSAELIVLQVVAPAADAAREETLGAAKAARADVALQILAKEVAGARGRGKVVVDTDPAQAILRAIDDEHVDAVVVGNVGMAGRKQFLLANIPNRVSHNARCNIIIVNTAQLHGPGATRRRDSTSEGDAARTATPGARDQDPARARQDERQRAPEPIRCRRGRRDARARASNS